MHSRRSRTRAFRELMMLTPLQLPSVYHIGVFRKSALDCELEKRQIGKIRREPNNPPGCYTAVAYCLCLNNYTCTQNPHTFEVVTVIIK